MPVMFLMFAFFAYANYASNESLSIDHSILSNSCSLSLNESFTFKLRSQYDLWTLDHWDVVSDDLICKLGNESRKFCTFETHDEKHLSRGLLFTYCLSKNDCDGQDVNLIGRSALQYANDVNSSGGIQNSSRFNERDPIVECVSSSRKPFGPGFWSMIFITAVLMIAFVAATVLQCSNYHKPRLDKEGQIRHATRVATFCRIFSLQSTCKKLMRSADQSTTSSTAIDSQQIDSVDFLRFITMLFFIGCHTNLLVQVFMQDLDGYRDKFRRSFFLQFIYHGTFGIGTFFAISGILQTYGVLMKLSRAKKDEAGNPTSSKSIKFDLQFWICLIVNRYLRIIPLYLFCILSVSYVLPQMANFSMWSPMDPQRQCPPEIWRHLLFLNNFKPLQLCMTWTWYLAVDFQLFLTSIPLTVSFVHRPTLALAGALSLILPFSLAKAFMVQRENFPPALMLLVPMFQYDQNFAKYSFEIYMRPYSWTSTYLCGLLTGYLIFRTMNYESRNGQGSFGCRKTTIIVLSFLAVSGIFWTAFGIYPQAMGIKNAAYDYSYATFSPLTWALAICWLVYSIHCFVDKNSIIRLILRFKIWTITSNLTFACYLIHLPFCFGFLLRYCSEKSNLDDSPTKKFLKVPLSGSEILGLAACSAFVSYFLALALYFLVESPAAQVQAIFMARFRQLRKNSQNVNSGNADALSRNHSRKEEVHLLEVDQRSYKI